MGLEYRISANTHAILQGYASRPQRRRDDGDLNDLTRPKFQLCLGLYRRIENTVLSIAITENLQNLNHTPDIGLQVGLAYRPAMRH